MTDKPLEDFYDEKQVLEDYFTFLRFPSISSEAEFKPQVDACVLWLEKYLQEIGFKTEVWPTSGHPTLFASDMEAGPGQPTLLIYNHYDVQPVDPLEAWESPPFEPTERQGQVYARGAQDNKGQCTYVLQALRLLKKRDGKLPINVKLCIEGEEECGSAGLNDILKSKGEALKADYLAIVDLGIPDIRTPAVTLGIRGIATMDIEVEGSLTDLHSGSHGGLAYNPLRALAEILAKLYEPSGRVAVPGFYEGVEPVGTEEKDRLDMTFDVADYRKIFGGVASGGERGLEPRERNWLQPTLEINGIAGGYTGAGFKTVIPAKACAKVSCRLVPGQDPDAVAGKVAAFIESQAPEGIVVRVNVHQGGGRGVRSSAEGRGVCAFADAFAEVFGAPCKFILEGASIPVVTNLARASGGELILLGLGLPGDFIHAPNEHFGVDRLQKGCFVVAEAIERLANKS